MKNTLQLRYTLADVADVKKGMYYVAEKSGGVRWEAADSEAGAIANYEADRRQQPVKACHLVRGEKKHD